MRVILLFFLVEMMKANHISDNISQMAHIFSNFEQRLHSLLSFSLCVHVQSHDSLSFILFLFKKLLDLICQSVPFQSQLIQHLLMFELFLSLLRGGDVQLLQRVEHRQLCLFAGNLYLLLLVDEESELGVNFVGLCTNIFDLFLDLGDFLFEIIPLHRLQLPASPSYLFH